MDGGGIRLHARAAQGTCTHARTPASSSQQLPARPARGSDMFAHHAVRTGVSLRAPRPAKLYRCDRMTTPFPTTTSRSRAHGPQRPRSQGFMWLPHPRSPRPTPTTIWRAGLDRTISNPWRPVTIPALGPMQNVNSPSPSDPEPGEHRIRTLCATSPFRTRCAFACHRFKPRWHSRKDRDSGPRHA